MKKRRRRRRPPEGTRFGPARAALLEGAESFRVRPWRHVPPSLLPAGLTRRFWWRVVVFPDRDSQRRYHAWRTREADRDGFGAIVIPLMVLNIRRDRPPRLDSRLGEVLLRRGALGTELISHEAVHVAASTLRLLADAAGDPRGLDLGDEIGNREEQLAYMAGGFARDTVAALYDLGAYGDGGRPAPGWDEVLRSARGEA